MPFGVLLDSGRDAFAFADTEVAAGSTFDPKATARSPVQGIQVVGHGVRRNFADCLHLL
jgi:hypothetical protein